MLSMRIKDTTALTLLFAISLGVALLGAHLLSLYSGTIGLIILLFVSFAKLMLVTSASALGIWFWRTKPWKAPFKRQGETENHGHSIRALQLKLFGS